MKTNKLWVFPVPSTSIHNGGVRLLYPGGDAWLVFDYYDIENNYTYNSGILFEGVQAHKHICEKFLESESEQNVKFIMNAYDTLVEFVDSDWIKYLQKLDKKTADYWNIKHFGILLDSNGFYEFIARSYKILERKEGGLDEFRIP